MMVYLAGGITGNLKPFWSEVAHQLAADNIKTAMEVAMKVFLAGGGIPALDSRGICKKKNKSCKEVTICECTLPESGRAKEGGVYDRLVKEHSPYILESFYYADDDTEKLLPYFGDFLLDSGAFTYMQGNHSGPVNWEDYIQKYADFINRNNIEKFFELDIDSIVGYSEVIRLRHKLEYLTGKKCIPVWHKSRGKNEFLKMCDEYSYVAVGGIVSKEIKPSDYWIFTWLIDQAHSRGCKIHGLGFTNLEGMRKYHFDSVDSTSWTIGNRFGKIYKFNGTTMIHYDKPKGARLADSRAVALNNFMEWLKFQRYAEVHL